MHANDVSFRSLSVCVFPLSSLSLSLFFLLPLEENGESRALQKVYVSVSHATSVPCGVLAVGVCGAALPQRSSCVALCLYV